MPKQRYLLRYGTGWTPGITDAEIEMICIQRGGEWENRGKKCGRGLYYHIKQLQTILWPNKDWHRWNEMLLKQFIKHRIVGIIGAASTGKSHESALYALIMYYCFPRETTVLVSSTEREMLEMRIWGEIKKYHKLAKERFPFIPGELIESKQRIVTDIESEAEYEDEEVQGRDFRNGVCGVPTKKGGNWIGIASLVGVKNKRVIMIADELQFMPKAFIDAISNLNKNQGFKCIGMGNPKDTTDPLGMLCEPSSELGGWEGGIDQEGPTKFWKTRYLDGVCVQLVGSDSPNFDAAPELAPPYPYLIKRSDIDADRSFYGSDSLQFTMMDEGRMPRGESTRRVITRAMCNKFKAMEDPVWTGDKRTKIGCLDAAYGNIGGDRCVFGELQFGKCIVDGEEKVILALIDTQIVPVSVREKELPEDQIARFVKQTCENRDIPPQNMFFDSTGRGTLMSAFARLWSAYVVPIEFGGKPTERIVSQERRVKACDYYSKRVTELWYNVRLCIESGQFRGMTEEVLLEGCMREWTITKGNKIEVESKDQTKKRMSRSPDCFVAGTMVETITGQIPIESLRIGDLVLTPFGYSAIVATQSELVDQTTKVRFSNGACLEGKGKHRIFTIDKGFVRLDTLSLTNDIESRIMLPIWIILNTLFTMDGSSGFKHQADIIRTKTGTGLRRDFFTESYGLRTMDLFLTACVFIIKMVTGQIIRSPTWNWLQNRITRLGTCVKNFLIQTFSQDTNPTWIMRESTLLNGTVLKKEGRGILNTVKKHGEEESYCKQNAYSVETSSIRSSRAGQNTVLLDASKETSTRNVFQTIGFVKSVVRSLWLIVTKQRVTVQESARISQSPESKRVYNLTLSEHNVYYANGILVENCFDAVVAGVDGAIQRGFRIGRLGAAAVASKSELLNDMARRYAKLTKDRQLAYR